MGVAARTPERASEHDAPPQAPDHWIFGPWLWGLHFAMIAGLAACVNIWVIPTFAAMLRETGTPLPGLTQALVDHSWSFAAAFVLPVLLYRPTRRWLGLAGPLVVPSVVVVVYVCALFALLALPLVGQVYRT